MSTIWRTYNKINEIVFMKHPVNDLNIWHSHWLTKLGWLPSSDLRERRLAKTKRQNAAFQPFVVKVYKISQYCKRPFEVGPNYIHCLWKIVSTFKLSVTLSYLNRILAENFNFWYSEVVYQHAYGEVGSVLWIL